VITKSDWEGAIAYLRKVVDADMRQAVIQFAAESNVTPERWLEKCTFDVSFSVLKGLEGEEVKWTITARKRTPADGPPTMVFPPSPALARDDREPKTTG